MTMKQYRLLSVMIIILLCVTAVLVFAQDATSEQTASVVLPPSMDYALVPCGDGVTGPCDMIATKAEDIAGVWKQYLGNPRFNAPGGMGYIRYNADGTFVWADSIENTAQPNKGYPAGTFSFDGAEFIIGPAVGTPPPCDTPPHYQLRVLKYGDKPVALRAVKISDDCPSRAQDLTQAGIWVAPGSNVAAQAVVICDYGQTSIPACAVPGSDA